MIYTFTRVGRIYQPLQAFSPGARTFWTDFSLILRKLASRDTKTMCDMFCVYARPILEYATEVWSPKAVGLIDKIERVQRSFTKQLPNCSEMEYPERLAFLQIDSLELRRLIKDLVLTYKIVHGQSVLNPDSYFDPSATYTRGHGYRFRPPRCNLTGSKSFFAVRVVSVWNALPRSVVEARSAAVFKERLDNLKAVLRPFLRLQY